MTCMTSDRKLDEQPTPPLPPQEECSLATAGRGPTSTSTNDSKWSLRIAISSTSPVSPSAPRSQSPCISPASLPSPTAAAAAPDRSTSPTLGSPSPAPSLPPATLSPTYTEHYVLMSGTLEDLHPFSDGSVDWLLDISLLAFGPYAAGVLRCHRDNTAAYWSTKELESSRWRDVKRGEAMEAKVYEFTPDVDGVIVSPRCVDRTPINGYRVRDYMSEFRSLLVRRDEGCVITGNRAEGCIAAHLIPERMGELGVQEIVRVFQRPNTPREDPMSYHKSDPRVGVLADAGFVGRAINGFALGFKATSGQNTYTSHVFHREGIEALDQVYARRLIVHDTPVTFHSDSPTPPPPRLVLDWHYLQCAFQRFGTAMSSEPSRCYQVEPARNEDEDDEDEEEDEHEPSYPSARAEAAFRPFLEQQRMTALGRDIRHWNGGLGSARPLL